MPSFFSKIRTRLSSPSSSAKSKSTGDLSFTSTQGYVVSKEKDLPKLHLAAWKGQLDKVTALCRPDKINLLDRENRTALHLAVSANHLAVVQRLLMEDAKISVLDRDNRSPLTLAAVNGNAQIMELLLDHLEQKNLVNIPDRNGLNVVFYAVKAQNGLSILRLLFQRRLANLAFFNKDKNTALHFAVIQKNYDATELLLEAGAIVDSRNMDGRTPLMMAAIAGDARLVESLLSCGADPSLQDKSGKAATDLCQSEQCIGLLKGGKGTAIRKDKSQSETTDSFSEGTSSKPRLTKKKSESEPNLTTTDLNEIDEDEEDEDEEDEDDEGTSQANTEEKLTSRKSLNEVNSWSETESSQKHSRPKTALKHLRPAGSEEYGLKAINNLVNNNNNNNTNDDVEIVDDNFLLDVPYALDRPKQSEPTFTSFRPESKGKDADNNDETPNWSIFIYTSNLPNAGTDSNVHIQIFGNLLVSERLHLTAKSSTNQKQLFEKGSCDRFDRKLPYIGKPIRIKIGHDNKGLAAGWHLDKVVLHDIITDSKFLFKCERWLAKDEADGKLEVEFDVVGGKKMTNESSTSWNSSEDEDSLSFGGGGSGVANSSGTGRIINKQSLIQVPNPNLNQIDELNETNASKVTNNFQTNESFMRKLETSIQFGAIQQISEFEDSDSETDRNRIAQQSRELEESFELDHQPKASKTQTLGQMFLKNNVQPKKRVNYDTPRDQEDTKSQSLGSFINQPDDTVNTTSAKKPKGQGLNLIISEILGVEPPKSGLYQMASEIIESPRSNTFSISTVSSKKSKNKKKNEKETGQKEKVSNNKNGRSNDIQIDINLSDWSESEKSESIGDLKRTVDAILEPRVNTVKNEPVLGLSGLLREEFSKKDNFFVGSIRDKTTIESSTNINLIGKVIKDRPPSISSFDESESSHVRSQNQANQVEGLSSLVKKEFTNNKKEFFVSSLNDTKPEVEGLSSLVKKEFTNNKKEFFVSSLNDNKESRTSSVSEASASNHPTGLNSVMKEALNQMDKTQKLQTKSEDVESLTSLVKKEFTNNKKEFFVSSLNDTKPEVEGLSSLVKKEFTNNKKEFFVSSLNDNKESRTSSVSEASTSNHLTGLNSVMKEALNQMDKTQRLQTKSEDVESLTSLVKKEFTNNKKGFFVSSLNDTKPEVEGLSSLVTKEFTNNKKEFFVSSLNEPKQSYFGIYEKSEPSRKSSSDIKSPEPRKPQFLSPHPDNNDISINSLRSDDDPENTARKIPLTGVKKMTPLTSQNKPKISGNFYDSDTESSSFSEEVFSSKHPGTIGTALGSIINPGNSSSSANNSFVSPSIQKVISPTQRKPQTVNSFANLVPELFDVNNNLNESNTSQLNQSVLLKTKQNELEQTRALLDEFRTKNAVLSSEKHAAEVRLKEEEAKSRGLITVCGEKERELAKKERQLQQLGDLDILKRQVEQLKGENENLASRLLQSETKEDMNLLNRDDSQQRLVNTSSFVNSSEEFGLIAARLPPPAISAAEVRVKALETQIEALNFDRNRLSLIIDETNARLEVSEEDVRTQNEALQTVTNQFNIEKNLLIEQNHKARLELDEYAEIKNNLNLEIERLKNQLNEKNFRCEQLVLEKNFLEKQVGREESDSVSLKRDYEQEIAMLKEQVQVLNKELGLGVVKLVSAEKEYQYLKSQVEDRQAQIDELRKEATRYRSEVEGNLRMIKIERQEKEELLKKCAQLEDNIKSNINEIERFKKVKNTDNGKMGLDGVVEENKKLYNELKLVNERMRRAETELEQFRTESFLVKDQGRNDRNDSLLFRDDDVQQRNENESLKNEVQKLKADFNLILSKYSPNDVHSVNEFENSTAKYSKANTFGNGSIKRSKSVDVPGLITDLPLQTIASLNNYVIKNIIYQETTEDSDDVNISNLIPDQPHYVISKKNSLYAVTTDPNRLTSDKKFCQPCMGKSKSYIDQLKYDLFKRIELEVNREMPVEGLDVTARRMNQDSNVSIIKSSTENFDSLYHKIRSNQTNLELMNSLRSKYLI